MRDKKIEFVREEIIEAEEIIVSRAKATAQGIPEKFRRLDIYKICSYFLICAFIGWIWETIAVWVMTGKITDRGFLFIMKPLGYYFPFLQRMAGLAAAPLIWGLPVIVIYGLGGMAVCSLFKRWSRHSIELFFIGMTSLTLLELLSSYLCGWMLHRQYWDYSAQFLNFQGRICLSSALAWGVLCVVGVKLFAPRIDRLYMHIKTRRNFKAIVVLLVVYVAICALVKYFLDPTIIPN